MRHFTKRLFAFIMLLTPGILFSQNECDLEMAYKLKQFEVRDSHVDSLSYKIIDLAGPRLTGSDGMERGYKVAEQIMKDYGLTNVKIDFARKWERGGWDVEKAYAAITVPYYMHVYPAPVGWCGSTNGLVSSEVVLIVAKNNDELKKYEGKLNGKIVLMPSTSDYQTSFTPMASRHTEESLKRTEECLLMESGLPLRRGTATNLFSYNDILKFVREESPAVIINENGNFNVPGITFLAHKQDRKPSPCEINITLEAHGLMERLIKNGERVKMDIDIKTKFTENRDIYNVMGEIEGCDPELKDQIILLGAHLDSYHLSGGAGDDAAGCIAMLEAVRLLKLSGAKPRRTIRVVLWGGEEMGLHGSSGYVEQYVADLKTKEPKKEYEKISVYFNSDYGPGKFRGIYTQDNIMAKPIFQSWITPFEDMGFTAISNRSVGSTDHIPFDNVGIPGFQFIQDGLEWGRGSHKVMDTAERLIYDDLRHNSVIVAWFAYNAAMRDEMFPRKPLINNTYNHYR